MHWHCASVQVRQMTVGKCGAARRAGFWQCIKNSDIAGVGHEAQISGK
jgi:hypothetical protein